MKRPELETGMGVLCALLAGGCGDERGVSEPLPAVRATALITSEQAKLSASDAKPGDLFGAAVSVSGETAVIGAPGRNQSRGAAYVFTRNGSVWLQDAVLGASDAVPFDRFGTLLRLSDDTVVIGAPFWGSQDTGVAYVFVRTGSTWSEQAILAPDDALLHANFPYSLGISGDTIVAAFGGMDAAYVFVRNGSTWTQQAKLQGLDTMPSDYFGSSADVSGDTAIVGAPWAGGHDGACYVFTRNGTVWTQQAKLTGSPPAGDHLGYSVRLEGDRAIVGTEMNSAYVFQRSGVIWTQQSKLPVAGSILSVGMSAETAIVNVRDSFNHGSVPVFLRGNDAWAERGILTASDGAPNQAFSGISLSGDTVFAGMSSASAETGAVYVFRLQKEGGDPCSDGTQCPSGHCVDGVCCDTACGGSVDNDCEACSKTAGSSADGTCSPLTGTSCSDGNACTENDKCQAGSCMSGSAVTCIAVDECHEPGTCDPVSGCTGPAKADGSGCTDNDACTQTDTCQSGVCAGGNPVICSASDECHDPGACDPASGTCSNPAKNDGAPCTGGACAAGVCVSTPDAGPDGEAGAGGTAGAAGAGGTSGAAGAGGTSGAAGAAGSSGAAGAGGSTGKGGSGGAQTGGTAGDAPTETAADTGGCGCRTGGRHSSSIAWMGLGIAIAVAVRRRRTG